MAASILAGVKGYFASYRPQAGQVVAQDHPDPPAALVDVSYPATKKRSHKK